MGIVAGEDITFTGVSVLSFMPIASTVALPSGGFVVTWVDSSYTIHVEKYDNDGDVVATGSTALDGAHAGYFAPTLTVLDTGDIAVAWTAAVSGTDSDVMFQLFDSNLVASATPNIVVNTNSGELGIPQLTAVDAGVAIAWFGDAGSGDLDVWTQTFDPSAAPTTNIRGNSLTTDDQGYSTVAGLGDRYVVTWLDESDNDVHVRVFHDDGINSSADIAVGGVLSAVGGVAESIALVNGGFVTAWSSDTTNDDEGVAFRIFDEDGVAVSAITDANLSTGGAQVLTSITALAHGGFVVAWGACGCSGSESAFAIFNDTGTAVTTADIVLDTDPDTTPTVKAFSDGSFVAAWVVGDHSAGDLGLAIRVFTEDGSLLYSKDVDLDNTIEIVPGVQPEIHELSNGGFVLSIDLDGSVAASEPSYYSQVFDITRDGPTSSNSTVTLLESASYTFTSADFPFSDAEGDNLTDIQITSLPTNGTLKLSGVAVTAGQIIPSANIGNLVWTPVAGANGSGLASLSYKLTDDGGTANGDSDTSSTYAITFNVTRINDAPSAANVTRTALEDAGYVFSAGSFGFSDGEGDQLKTVTISSLPAVGELTLNGQAVTAGQSISGDDIAAGKLIWTPPAETSGTNLASLTFKVQDTGGTANGGLDTSGTYTLKFDVSAVNDAPVLDYQGLSTTAENAKLKMDVLSGASDIDGGTLKLTDADIVTGFGKLTINKDGTLTYDPTKAPNQDIAEGESKTVTISYAVSDGNGGQTTDEIDITVEGISPDIFRGTAKRDKLVGTTGDDRIFGLANNDRLDGRGGDDFMKGGKQADTFVFGADYGRDTIVDFKPEDGDRIDLSDAAGIKNFKDLMRDHVEDVGKSLVITADDGSMLVLKRVDPDDLGSDNFLF